jgi:hypothetical protein
MVGYLVNKATADPSLLVDLALCDLFRLVMDELSQIMGYYICVQGGQLPPAFLLFYPCVTCLG